MRKSYLKKEIPTIIVIGILLVTCYSSMPITTHIASANQPHYNRRAIMLTGYWNPTGQMLEKFSQNITLNPGGWKGENWEGLGYDVYSFFALKRNASDYPYQGDFEIDYQDVSADFWRITDELDPIAIISFGFGSSEGLEIEYNARNLPSWWGDYQDPTQPTPSPPDASVPAFTIRHSTLPIQAIADAVTLQTNHIVEAMGDWHTNPGSFLCEYMAYHDAWYQSLHNDTNASDCCLAAGFIHAGSSIGSLPYSELTNATEIILRTTIHCLDEARNADTTPTQQTWGPGQVEIDTNITIPAGNTLEVLPNTTVIFTPGTHLSIQGSLWANGTTTQPIMFTAPQTPHGWQGILFNTWTAQGALRNCTIANATWDQTSSAITISGVKNTRINITDSLITGNNNGVRLIDTPALINITRCIFTNNGDGIFFSTILGSGSLAMHPRINNNTFLGNHRFAIGIERIPTGTTIDARYNAFGTINPLQVRNMIQQPNLLDYSNLLDTVPPNIQRITGTQIWDENDGELTSGTIVDGDLAIEGINITLACPLGYNIIQVNGNLTISNAQLRSPNGDATLLYCAQRPTVGPASIHNSILEHVQLGIQNRSTTLQTNEIRTSRLGVCLLNCNSSLIQNCTISHNLVDGLSLITSQYCTLTSTTISNNSGSGCSLIQSNNNVIQNCVIAGNDNGITLRPKKYLSQPSRFNIIRNCTIEHNQGDGLLLNFVRSIGGGTGLITIVNCTIDNNDKTGLKIIRALFTTRTMTSILKCSIYQNGVDGISLFQTVSDTIDNCSIFNNRRNGIVLETTTDSDINYNNITNSRIFNNQRNGIAFNSYGWNMHNNTIANCTIQGNQGDGVTMEFFVHKSINPNANPNPLSCSLNTFQNNYIIDNENGLRLTNVTQNLGRLNIYQGNSRSIQLITSQNNIICSNAILVNELNASDTGTNIWNATYEQGGGNYWDAFDEESEGAYDNYEGPAQDIPAPNGDGIVDNETGGINPYLIANGGNHDWYPTVNYQLGDPIAVPDTYTVSIGTTLYITAPGVLANDHDRDHPNQLTSTLTTGPVHGTVQLNSNGAFNYTPNTGFQGLDWFTYTADDGIQTSRPATVLLLIRPQNHAPEAIDDTATVLEDSHANQINVLTNDIDEDRDALRIQSIGAPSHGSVTAGRTYVFYTPSLNYSGFDSFNYTIRDCYGETSTATVTISVTPVNDPPSVLNIPDQTINHDETFRTIQLDGYVRDVDNLPSEMQWSTSLPVHLLITINNRMAIIGLADPNWYGQETVTFTARDPGGLSGSDPVTFSVRRPIWVDDDYDEHTPGWGIDHFNTIQHGVNAIDTNGAVYVHDGTYREHIIINRPMNILATDHRDRTIIDGSQTGTIIQLTAPNVKIRGFTIQNPGNGLEDAGIIIPTSKNQILENIIIGNSCGIRLVSDQAQGNQVIGNIITSPTTGCYGIELYKARQNCLSSNLVKHYLDGGFIHEFSDGNEISQNNFYDNGIGLVLYHASDNSIKANNFIRNWADTAEESEGANYWAYNYWDDYLNHYPGFDVNHDGFWDIPYLIPASHENHDPFPKITPYGFPIHVMTPNGGETWIPGTTQTIEWESDEGITDTVLLSISLDNNVSWIKIDASPNSAGYNKYNWDIPKDFPTSSTCLVKIESIYNEKIFDMSDDFFTIK